MNEAALGQCALTGKQLATSCLLRFVLSPSGQLVLDLNAELEGKELWIEAKKAVLESTEAEKLLQAHFDSPLEQLLKAPLSQIAEKALRRRALDFIGLAKRNGAVISGFTKACEALKKGKAAILLLDGESDYKGKDDITQLAENVLIITCFTLSELQSALSSGNAVHVILKEKEISAALEQEMKRLLSYLER